MTITIYRYRTFVKGYFLFFRKSLLIRFCISRERLTDPVSTESHAEVVHHGGFENAAAAFDRGGRSHVVIVAGHEDVAHTLAARDLNGCSQNRSCVSPATKRWAYAVANVAASIGEEVIQFESDPRTANELTLHDGREKGRTNSTLGHVNSLAIALHEGDPLRPRRSRVKIGREEVKIFVLELCPCGEGRRFVGGDEGSQDQ
jgi:hypothetical protein